MNRVFGKHPCIRELNRPSHQAKSLLLTKEELSAFQPFMEKKNVICKCPGCEEWGKGGGGGGC